MILVNSIEIASNIYDKTSSRLYTARKAKNLKILELAKLAKVSPGTIGDTELGKHKPSVTVLRKLSKVLDVSISYLGNFDELPEDTLGQKIKKARLYHGLTQIDFADLIGVRFDTVISWERGYCAPKPKIRIKVNEYLKILHK